MYLYVKAFHLIFIVTWFAALFYIVRLFIYNTEAGANPDIEKSILRHQFKIMIRRLWLIIGWPSAILAIAMGLWLWYLMDSTPNWFKVKLALVALLFIYHLSIQYLYSQQVKDVFKYSSQQLRLWNELATIFLIAIVLLAVVKNQLNLLQTFAYLVGFMVVLFVFIRVYKRLRDRNAG